VEKFSVLMKIYKYIYSSQTFSPFSICWLTFLVLISVGIVVLQGVLVNPPSAKNAFCQPQVTTHVQVLYILHKAAPEW
jgi:hypothetical protein